MDFLDPRKKNRQSIQLAIGHTLMALLVIVGTYILVSQAYGFDVDRSSGSVIRNGLVFIDSAPDKAKIYLNGSIQRNPTNTRISVPEGKYNLSIKKDGYREWSREFALEGGYVERFTYPMLIPDQLQPSSLQTITALPTVGMQSPDRRWVLLGNATLNEFTQYDLNSLKDKKPTSKNIIFPAGLFSPGTGSRALEVVEWSSDNKNVLLKHTFSDGFEFIVLNRDDPTKSINVNRSTNLKPSRVFLRDKKPDQLYLYTEEGGLLQFVDSKNNKTAQVLTGVTSFKSHGSDILLYSQPLVNESTKNRIYFKNGDKTYTIMDVPAAQEIRLDVAQYDGKWYLVVGSSVDKKVYIYKNPQDYIDSNNGKRPAPISILKTTDTIKTVKFSQNTRFIMANSAQHFAVYDAENDRTYSYDLSVPFDQAVKPDWMDGHRIVVNDGSQTIIFDYDGINIQKLVPADKSIPAFFNRDYTFLYSVSPQPSGFDIMQTALRIPQDL